MRAPDWGRWPDAVVPAAVTSWQAQTCNALASGVGAAYVIASVAPSTSTAVTLLVAIALQALTAGLVAALCRGRAAGRVVGLAVAGVCRGLALSAALVLLGWPAPPAGLGPQIAASVAFTAVWLVGAGRVVEGARRFQSAFGARFDEAVRQGLAESERRSSAAWSHARLAATAEHNQAGSRLDDVAEAAVTDPVTLSAELARVADALHVAAHERIRPLSHRLWAHGVRPDPELPLTTVLLRALTSWPARVAASAVFTGAVVGAGAMPRSGVVIGVFVAVVSALVTAGCLAVREGARRRHRRVLSALAFAAIVPAAFVALEGVGRLLDLPENVMGSATAAAGAFGFALLAVAVSGVTRHRAWLLAEMDALLSSGYWAKEVAESIERRHAGEAATFLHHRVQSQLLAAALQLEIAAQEGSAESAELALSRIRDNWSTPTAALDLHPGRAALDRLPDEWDGICEVRLDIPSELQLSQRCWEAIDFLVHECVANAVRSGGSQRVDVTVAAAEDNGATVEIVDDGSARSSPIPGMGTAWMRATCASLDSGTTPSGGMRLVAHVTDGR